MQIPILTKAGRGLPFYYILTYDTSVWYPSSASGTKTWTQVGSWGWGTLSQPEVGSVSYTLSQASCNDQLGDIYYYSLYSKWVYYDSMGAPHPTPFTLQVGNGSIVAPNCKVKGPNYNAKATVIDGSGYTLAVSAAPAATAYARSGTVIQPVVGSQSVYATDANGNQISYNGSWFTDTLGLTALTISGSPPNARTFTYTNPSGGNSSFTMSYTQMTVQTNFGCSGVTEYGATSQYLVTSITLPDLTTYNFTYEATYGDTHNPHYVTGRIASVQLPTGGTISYSYPGGSNSNGITCADGSASGLSRTTPDGEWTYTRGTGSQASTTLQDPQGNQTVIDFQGIYETERQVNQGTSTLLETVNTCYNNNPSPCTSASNTTAITLPISNRTVQVTLPNLSAPSQTATTYNTYGLTTETDEYNYAPSLVRKTVTSYAGCGVTNANVVDRACTLTIENASGGAVASASYSYDASGNRTGETDYTGGTPSTVSRAFTYGSYGVLTSQTDFNANTTSYSSFACGSNTAFPQTASLPLSFFTSTSWNCNGGVVTQVKNPNNQATAYSYDTTHNLWRVAETSFPNGGSTTTAHTSTTQTDVETAITSSTSRHDQLDLDGLGRVLTSALVSDPDGETYVTTSYDALGRTSTVSNPYRTSSVGNTYAYDALNRVTKVTHADSSYFQIAYGGSASQSCSPSTYGYGYPTLYSDEVQDKRQTFTDALGRVIEVDEPNSSGSLTVNTCYTYDVLNNLYQLLQGSETRTFVHDELSRLTQATTPEAGTVYLYYSTTAGALCSGNPKAVCRRTDARGITTTYTYDSLNRNTGKSYSNSNPTATAYTYDQTSCLGLSVSCYNKGQRTTMTDASGSTQWAYDAMGRVLIEHRTIGSVTNNIAYTYNLDGSIATLTYPSGRTITYTVSAAQRAQSAVDTADSINYVLDATYAPQGALGGALLGESGSFGGITYAATYTNRMLPYTVSATSSAGSALNLTFGYYANRNVETITNNLNTARTQTFTYDNLNRLATAQTQATSGTYCWGQGFGYDRYANLQTATVTQCTAPMLSLSVNTNNQITNSGFAYDASGDMASDGTYSYAWDARNRLQSAGGVSYTYDGDGKRVMKSSGTLYWNSPDGTALAETNSSGTTLNEYIFFYGNRIARRDSSGNVYYYFQDQLATTKTLTTSAGVVCYDADFLAFGSERPYTISCAQNYKFTGLERDSETGNDHTLHRMYDSSLGRWLTPDRHRGDLFNPQSWNRYGYVMNNPTSFADPLGLTAKCPVTEFVMRSGHTTDADCGPGGGVGGGGVSIDGGGDIPSGLDGLLGGGFGSLGGSESTVPCPGNVCEALNEWGQIVQFTAFADGGQGYYPVWGPGGIYDSVQQAEIASSEWGTWYLEQTGNEIGGSVGCGSEFCSSTIQGGQSGWSFMADLFFRDLPSGMSGEGWWRATNGESPSVDLTTIDWANSLMGTSFPLYSGTTSGGGRVLLYDPATQGPYECVLVGGPWYYGNAGPCQ